MCGQPLGHRLALIDTAGDNRRALGSRRLDDTGKADALSRSVPRQRAPPRHTTNQVPRWRPGRTHQIERARLAIDHRQCQSGLERRIGRRADSLEKRKRVAIATEHHVLSVVDSLARFAIDEGRRPPAQPGRGLGHDHAPAHSGQRDCGAQTGAAGADDDDVGRHRRRRHVWIASQACAGRGTRITRVNTS